ncbi:hypothetical protein N9937_01850 [bacterium]|nr:hypothetical protein [bacterium]
MSSLMPNSEYNSYPYIPIFFTGEDMIKHCGDVPINRAGALFLLEKGLAEGYYKFSEFPLQLQRSVIYELALQTEVKYIEPLAKRLGLSIKELQEHLKTEWWQTHTLPEPSQTKIKVVWETIIFFKDEILDLMNFLRDHFNETSDYVMVDTCKEFAVSFDPNPCY